MTTYKIKSGDTLTSIAKAFNTTVDSIASANGIKNKNLIYAGNSLTIPDTTSVKSGGTSEKSLSGGGVLLDTTKPSSNAKAQLESWKGRRPAEYKERYTAAIDSLLSELRARNTSYDAAWDPTLRLYRDKYLSDARLAMEDAASAATAKTGGYGNSYASAAGNRAYADTMGNFAEVLPELYRAAYNRYSSENDDLISKIKLIASLSDDEWSRYSTAMKNYLSEGELLWDSYEKLSKNEGANYLKYLSLMNK